MWWEWVCCLTLLLAPTFSSAQEESCLCNESSHDEDSEIFKAVLFPWFFESLGVISLYILTRLEVELPYTAVMFVEGVIIGVLYQKTNLMENAQVRKQPNSSPKFDMIALAGRVHILLD
mmetsp:Transcript_13126/g.17081  ORF Transcript_13126/g.17081 Transcript_13126/m.17081 type:complete len:119 (-) Transcript_13126:32-388(-)